MVFGVLLVAGVAVLTFRHHEKKKARRTHVAAATAAAAPTSQNPIQPAQANTNPPYYYENPNMSNAALPRGREQWDEPLPEWEAVAKIEEKQEKGKKF